MTSVTFREMTSDEIGSMADIDRAETIDGIYTATNGMLTFEQKRIDVAGWYPTEIPDHVAGIRAAIQAGGAAFGAWDGDTLVGIIGLRIEPVGGDPTVMQLEPLHVSANHRNQGIGRKLVEMIAERARSLGGTAIYISSIPTRNSVDAYIRFGARVLAEPDPTLFEYQPEDIHLILPLFPVAS